MKEERLKSCKDEFIREYIKKHKKTFNQPIMKSFLENKDYLFLFKKFVKEPNKNNYSNLDHAFKRFYLEARLISYLSKLIYYHAIDSQKKERRYLKRNLCVLNESIDDDNNILVMDLYKVENNTEKQALNNLNNSIVKNVGYEKLQKALLRLTSNQLKVIDLIYREGLNIKIIAEYFGSTPQNISKIHINALNNLKKDISEEK